MNILYLPILEEGTHHETAVRYKHGLQYALAAYGEVDQLDYLEMLRPHGQDGLFNEVRRRIAACSASLLVTQIHGVGIFTLSMLKALRAEFPSLRIVNWNGDPHLWGLTTPEMLELLREIHLQLVINPAVLPIYEAHGVSARYWFFGYEEPTEDLPDMPAYDVIFQGNVTTESRKVLLAFLRDFGARHGVSVGIYGDAPDSDGNTLYNFPAERALYRRAKIAIGDNPYPEQHGYLSNRLLHCMAAGGALMLHQRVEGIEALLGLVPGKHFVEWDILEDLETSLLNWLDGKANGARLKTVRRAYRAVEKQHSFDARVKQLMEEFLPELAGVK